MQINAVKYKNAHKVRDVALYQRGIPAIPTVSARAGRGERARWTGKRFGSFAKFTKKVNFTRRADNWTGVNRVS
jgi:hypothetical protein